MYKEGRVSIVGFSDTLLCVPLLSAHNIPRCAKRHHFRVDKTRHCFLVVPDLFKFRGRFEFVIKLPYSTFVLKPV